MKAVALTRYLPIDDPQSLLDVELPKPSAPTGHDLLVRVEAVSVNSGAVWQLNRRMEFRFTAPVEMPPPD